MKQPILFFLILISSAVFVLQAPVFSQYLFISNTINPTNAGRAEYVNMPNESTLMTHILKDIGINFHYLSQELCIVVNFKRTK